MRTLLLAQRVDRTFKATIDGSVKLQRKLWLLPDTCAIARPTDEEDMTVNPLLESCSMTGSDKPVLDVEKDHRREAYVCKVFARCQLSVQPLDAARCPYSWWRMQVARPQSKKSAFECHLDIYGSEEYYEVVLCSTTTLQCSITVGQMAQAMRDMAQKRHPSFFDNEGNLTRQGRKAPFP